MVDNFYFLFWNISLKHQLISSNQRFSNNINTYMKNGKTREIRICVV